MLREHRFLPLQQRAAVAVFQRVLREQYVDDSEQLMEQAMQQLFGAEREFMQTGRAITPLVNNITAAVAYVDQYGRHYAYADPSDWEDDPEPEEVPRVVATDRFFVAIPQAQRHAANTGELDPGDEGQWLPAVSEFLLLAPAHDRTLPAMEIEVVEIVEPHDTAPRISSGCVRLSGDVPVRHKTSSPPHQVLSEFIARLVL